VRIRDLVLGYVLEVRPPPMSAAVLAVILGSFMAYRVAFDLGRLLLCAGAVAFGLYTAHLKDTFADIGRGEYRHGYRSRFGDAGLILERRHLLAGIVFSSIMFWAFVLYLSSISTWLFAPIALLCWLIAITYSPYLDKRYVTVTISWPTGVVLAFVSGYLVQTGRIDPPIVLFGILFFVFLNGLKIYDDLPDVDVDRKTGKSTLPTLIGPVWAKRVAYALFYGVLGTVVLLIFAGPIPFGMIYGALGCVPFLVASQWLDPRRGVFVIVAGIHVLIPLLVLACIGWL